MARRRRDSICAPNTQARRRPRLPGGDISAFSPALTFSREEAEQTVELYERGLTKLVDWLGVDALWQGR